VRVSTEQILFPDRYAKGDVPIALQFPADSAVPYEDVLGEVEVRILMARLAGQSQVRAAGPTGWGGDRYRVYRSPAGPALVWVVVWDDPAASQRFESGYGAKLRATSRPGYRAVVEHLELDGKPATRYILAPTGWHRWANLPRPSITR
jgi:hypothetical protein